VEEEEIDEGAKYVGRSIKDSIGDADREDKAMEKQTHEERQKKGGELKHKHGVFVSGADVTKKFTPENSVLVETHKEQNPSTV
jgi:ribulose-5-phosphate 4-epimerase/fuculose-1-phosphate aldolase